MVKKGENVSVRIVQLLAVRSEQTTTVCQSSILNGRRSSVIVFVSLRETSDRGNQRVSLLGRSFGDESRQFAVSHPLG